MNFFLRKVFLEIGPLINLLLTLFLSKLIAISKQLVIYWFDFDVILLNPEGCLKFTLIKFILFNLFFFLITSFSFVSLKLIFVLKIFACFRINFFDAIKIIGDLIFFFMTLKKSSEKILLGSPATIIMGYNSLISKSFLILLK